MNYKITPSMEDYLEAIFSLGESNETIHVKDIADKLHVRMASVTEALQNLAKHDLVIYTPYKNVVLTKKGVTVGRQVYEKHLLLVLFLEKTLEIPHDIAELDACKMEHILSAETLDSIIRLMKRN